MQNECPAKWRMKQGNKIQELDMNEQYLCPSHRTVEDPKHGMLLNAGERFQYL